MKRFTIRVSLLLIPILTFNIIAFSQKTRIDILALYTKSTGEMLLNYGDPKSATEEINEAFDYLNTALENSQAGLYTHCVGIMEIDYVADPNDGKTLQQLRDPYDGYIDNIHAWRDSLGADLVVLITHGGGVSGMGGAPMDNSTDWDYEGFCLINVSNDMSADEDRTFAHEIGHSFGGMHDWYQKPNMSMTNNQDPYNYVNHNKGHFHIDTIAKTGFYTIMSYYNLGYDMGIDATPIPYFSNPNVLYEGVPTGIAKVENYWDIDYTCYGESTDLHFCGCPADNVDIFNWMAPYIKKHRSTSGPSGRPSEVKTKQEGMHIVNLSWTDTINNENGFKVFRSIDDSWNFKLLTTLPANTTSLVDTVDDVVTPEVNWVYRVQAFNDSSLSTYGESKIIIDVTCGSVVEDFESNSFTNLAWTNNSSTPWIIKDRTDGPGLAAKGDETIEYMGWVNGEQAPSLEITRAVQEGYIGFHINANTLMQFAIDDVYPKNAGVSLTWDYDTVFVPVKEGLHTFRWEFLGGGDVWLDNICFPPVPEYQVTYSADENGSINGVSNQLVNYGEDATEVEAVPNNNYVFVDWSDGSTENPRTDTTVIKDIEITANFMLATDIDETENLSFKVYPNPASNIITVEASNTSTIITIIDLNGKVITSQKSSHYKTNIDISYVNSGLYFVKVISDNSVSIQELIID